MQRSRAQASSPSIASITVRFKTRCLQQHPRGHLPLEFCSLRHLGMLFKTFSAAVFGIDAYLVETEVDVVPAYEGDFTVVGLPDIAVKESRERIRAALRNCGFDFPSGHAVTINLAPADIRKQGSAFDLPMALGLAGCQGSFFGKVLDTHVFLGELSLDGGVRSMGSAFGGAGDAPTRY